MWQRLGWWSIKIHISDNVSETCMHGFTGLLMLNTACIYRHPKALLPLHFHHPYSNSTYSSYSIHVCNLIGLGHCNWFETSLVTSSSWCESQEILVSYREPYLEILTLITKKKTIIWNVIWTSRITKATDEIFQLYNLFYKYFIPYKAGKSTTVETHYTVVAYTSRNEERREKCLRLNRRSGD